MPQWSVIIICYGDAHWGGDSKADENQVLALLIIQCFEDLLKHMSRKLIKQHCRAHPLEGDGPTWDTCCSKEITGRVVEYNSVAYVPDDWCSANCLENEVFLWSLSLDRS